MRTPAWHAGNRCTASDATALSMGPGEAADSVNCLNIPRCNKKHTTTVILPVKGTGMKIGMCATLRCALQYFSELHFHLHHFFGICSLAVVRSLTV